MSKKSRHGRETTPAVVDASLYFGDSISGDRRTERKERQLCRQVHEALGEALATVGDPALWDVWIESVEPAPDASRLAVIVRCPPDSDPSHIEERLARVAGRLRTEVAQAITRKRAPTLHYEVLPPETALPRPEQATSDREQGTSQPEQSTSYREQGPSRHEQGTSRHEQATSRHEQALSRREQALFQEDDR